MGAYQSQFTNKKTTSLVISDKPEFKGIAVSVVGSKDIPKIGDIDFPDDAVASLMVSEGYVVTLFSENNYKGESITYTGPTVVSAIPDEMAKKVSSLKISQKGSSFQQNTSTGMIWFFILIIIILILILIFMNRNKKK